MGWNLPSCFYINKIKHQFMFYSRMLSLWMISSRITIQYYFEVVIKLFLLSDFPEGLLKAELFHPETFWLQVYSIQILHCKFWYLPPRTAFQTLSQMNVQMEMTSCKKISQSCQMYNFWNLHVNKPFLTIFNYWSMEYILVIINESHGSWGEKFCSVFYRAISDKATKGMRNREF